MNELTYDEAVEMAQPLAESGAKVYFKFTCAHCGERVLFQEENSIYEAGECAACGKITDPITSYGLMVAFVVGGKSGDV